jgi:hypothetical protein
MPIIRRKLDVNSVYPANLRYDPDTDEVQSLVNGEWVDNPAADPRHQTTLPPRITSSPACDGAESVKDAFKGQIDAILLAIDNGGTAFTLAGIILALFTFGVFGVFISIALAIANAMLDAGTTALESALTEPVYEQFACILFCHMNSSGQITADGLAAAEADITDQIGGLAAIILNSMLALAGEGGVSNLSALGTSTGDCSGCACAWCYTFDFEASDGDWIGADAGLGTYELGVGWKSTFAVLGDGNGYRIIQLQRAFAGEITSIHVAAQVVDPGSHPYPSNWVYCTTNIGAVITSGGTPAAGTYVLNFTGDQTVTGITYLQVSAGFINGASDPGGEVVLKTVTIRGIGDNPFGADNCD